MIKLVVKNCFVKKKYIEFQFSQKGPSHPPYWFGLDVVWLYSYWLGHEMLDFSNCLELSFNFIGPLKFLYQSIEILTISHFYRVAIALPGI
jgi:hypothetical protein